jgi:hypothetical protein
MYRNYVRAGIYGCIALLFGSCSSGLDSGQITIFEPTAGQRALLQNENAFLELKRKASIMTESITDEFIATGKISVTSVGTTSVGQDGIAAKGYSGVSFRDKAALNDYILRVKPIVTSALGADFTNLVISLGSTQSPVVTSREVAHGIWSNVSTNSFNSINSGSCYLKLDILFSQNFWFNWHNWRLTYVDNDPNDKLAAASRSELFATKSPISTSGLHGLKEINYPNYGDGGVTTFEITNPISVALYSEGVYDDWQSHTWWINTSIYEYKAKLYKAGFTNEEILSLTR